MQSAHKKVGSSDGTWRSACGVEFRAAWGGVLGYPSGLMGIPAHTPGFRIRSRTCVSRKRAATFSVTFMLALGCGNGESLLSQGAASSFSTDTGSFAPTSGSGSGATVAPPASTSVSPVATTTPTISPNTSVQPQTTATTTTSSVNTSSASSSATTSNATTSSQPQSGTSSAATSSSAVTSEPEPEPVCENVQPPENEEWPGVTCFDWVVRSGECDKEWFEGYCDVMCGRCEAEGEEGPPKPPDCSGEGLPMVSGGDGFATRYWDCCQPHCAQQDGHKCSQDGTSRTGDGTSSCNGGGSFACYDEAPHAVSDCLSYGYIAKANPNCGGCYRIQFTGQGEHDATDPGSQMIQGKQMIVKVSNTGSDVAGNQFDLMVPGGGVGMFNACSRQWNNNDLGDQYGGFLSTCTAMHNGFEARKACVREGCMKIPAGGARDGCLWFVDWFQIADNPKFTSQQTDCPF